MTNFTEFNLLFYEFLVHSQCKYCGTLVVCEYTSFYDREMDSPMFFRLNKTVVLLVSYEACSIANYKRTLFWFVHFECAPVNAYRCLSLSTEN